MRDTTKDFNKTDLVERVAESGGLTKADAANAVNLVIAALKSLAEEGLATNRAVRLTDFGSFVPREIAASTRDTFGKPVTTPRHRRVKFEMSPTLDQKLRLPLDA